MVRIIAFKLCVLLSIGTVSLHAGDVLTLNIQNIRNAEGVIHVHVFDDAVQFEQVMQDTEKIFQADFQAYVRVPAKKGDIDIALGSFTDATRYAVMVYHDENENSDVEINSGSPPVGYGFSNNVGVLSVPVFQEASFTYEKTLDNISIDMRYFGQ